MRDRDYISDPPKASDAKRFWCAYNELEEYHAGMWKPYKGDPLVAIAKAVSLLRSEIVFRASLVRVLKEWPTSCRAEFTSPGNHLAWLGCAACCLIHGVPEALTRRAWWKLSEDQREIANRAAREAIDRWKIYG